MALAHFGLDEEDGCVDLGQPACGWVVSIDGVVGVVEYDDASLWHYYYFKSQSNLYF